MRTRWTTFTQNQGEVDGESEAVGVTGVNRNRFARRGLEGGEGWAGEGGALAEHGGSGAGGSGGGGGDGDHILGVQPSLGITTGG